MNATEQKIELLNSTNWYSWSQDIKVLLMDRGCYSFIDKSEPPFDESKASRKEILAYNLRKDRAFTTIYNSVNPEYKTLLSGKTDGAEAFKILSDYFEPTTKARIIQLLDEFFNLRFDKSKETIGLFCARLKNCVERLKSAGHPLETLYQGFQLIRYLPVEYAGIVQTIYRWEDKLFTYDNIVSELILEENRLAQFHRDTESNFDKSLNGAYGTTVKRGQSNYSRQGGKFSRNKKGKNFQNSDRIGPCHKCHNYGHLQHKCMVKDNKISKVNNTSKVKNTKDVNNFVNFSDKNNNNSIKESNVEVLFNQTSEPIDKFSWIIDSGATHHFCNNIDLFKNFKKLKDLNMTLAVDGIDSPVEGVGDIEFYFMLNGSKNVILLGDVLYSPKLRRNLVSGSLIEKNGKFLGDNGRIWVYSPNGVKMFFAKRKNGLYVFRPRYDPENINNSDKFDLNNVNVEGKSNVNIESKSNVNTESKSNVNNDINNVSTNAKGEIDLWHKRFCHINCGYLINTSRNSSVRGLPMLDKPTQECAVCKIAKAKRKTFKPLGRIRSKKPLELLHMDVCGPLPTASQGGNLYFLTITDDYSRKVVVFPMKNKSDVFELFTRFQRRAERFLNTKILSIRTDNGMEFCHRAFSTFLEEQGIRAECTNIYTPEQNGVSERYNFTALDGIKSMLKESKLDDKFWAEALTCFTYVWNRTCHKNQTKTPFELYSGNKPSVSHFKIFGCMAYAHTPKQKRTKLQMRARPGIMMGYAQKTRGYRIWLIEEKRMIETVNVNFNESLRGVEGILDPQEKSYAKFQIEDTNYSDDDEPDSDENLKPCSDIPWIRVPTLRKDKSRTDIYYKVENEETRFKSLKEIEKYCSDRKIKFDGELFDFSAKNTFSGKISDITHFDDSNAENNNIQIKPEVHNIEIKIPRNFKDVVNSPQIDKWQTAMDDEIKIMKERQVWELVPPPKEKVLGSRWVYTVKKNDNGDIVRYKARLVAKGFNQQKGESYDEVFSPVINFTVVRIFFALLVCTLGWFHCQLDIKCAYLYAKLSQNVYMSQPEGYVNTKKPNDVCLLKKAIYGLHQSGRMWFLKLDNVLKNMNFKKIKWCNCVYLYGRQVLLLVYVDDIVVFGKTQNDIDTVVNLLSTKFDLKILGKTKKLLGIEFVEKNDGIFIHQHQYIDKICNMFSRYNYALSSLPIAKGCVMSKLDCPTSQSELNEMSKLPFRSILGCLSFLANRTRPDISYTVNILSQFQENPGIKHWNVLLKLLGYIRSTSDFMLNLSKIKNFNIECFSDSDFATNRDDRISMGGMIFFIDKTPISWRTFKQKCISLSTMEAEYVSLTESAKEVIWVQNIIKECKQIGIYIKDSNLYCDNQAAIEFSNSPVENHRTKHIDVKYHFLRNLVCNKSFNVKYITSKKNLADVFTKPMTKETLKNFCDIVFFSDK